MALSFRLFICLFVCNLQHTQLLVAGAYCISHSGRTVLFFSGISYTDVKDNSAAQSTTRLGVGCDKPRHFSLGGATHQHPCDGLAETCYGTLEIV